MTEKAPLKVGAVAGLGPTMSAPMRSQSGSRFAFRIHDCRSGANTVLGGTRGLVADSQKKLSVPGEFHLRNEKVMIGRKKKRRRKIHVEPNFLTSNRSLTPRVLIRHWVNPV